MEDTPGAEAPVAAWLALALAAPLTPPVCRRLRERFPDPAALGRLLAEAIGGEDRVPCPLARTALAAPRGPLVPAHAAALAAPSTRRRIAETLARLAEDPLARLLPIDDPRYPAALAASVDPPPLLYVRGAIEALVGPAVAIVGAREATHGGRERARDIARDLAASGLVVVSGLALGTDAAAHVGALEGRGRTLAFVATGIDEVYPRRHRALAETLLERGGALASEFPLGHPPKPWGFPQRNRLISGASLGVVVVEARLPSGSLTTARHALEQGREVMAVPGAVDNPASAGCHALIRDGATLVTSADDVLHALAGPLRRALAGAETDVVGLASPARDGGGGDERNGNGGDGGDGRHGHGAGGEPAVSRGPPRDDAERRLRDALASGPATADRLVARAGLDVAAVLATLARLELGGVVVADAGGRYALARR